MRHSIRELQRSSWRSHRKRRVHDRRPIVESLEERALLSAVAHHHGDHGHAMAVAHAKKAAGGYSQINLVSDLPGAQVTDSNLKNPWGMAYSGTSPFWVSDQHTGVATIYTVSPSNVVTPLTSTSLVVTVPETSAGSMGSPTGQVFNPTATSSTPSFLIPGPGGTRVPAVFIFATLQGTIEGWNPGSNGGMKSAEIVATKGGAVYTGLALGSSGGQNFLYAANASGIPGIDVYNSSSFAPATLAGNFTDPKLKKGFAKKLTPYNIANIGGQLYVTYAGPNFKGGAVAVFNTDGTFVRQIAFNSASGKLQAPWGVTMAPSSFGKFSNDLLVGNFGNGRINAFNAKGKLAGQLNSSGKKPLVIPGLWALGVGNNGKAGSPNFVYFTAGINSQSDGLFGAIKSTT
jgi:uncharacterized protein (TIGR03118 family)